MPSPVTTLIGIVLALGAVEATAYWWMHPTPAGLGQPVLVYRPEERSQATGDRGQQDVEAQDPAQSSNSSSPISDSQRFSISASTLTTLPAVVEKALPTLRCSTGTAARIDRDDGTTIHVAFFEWDLADSTNVLEAFKHLPDECMGSIGMTLTGHQPPRSYQVGGETLWFDHTVFRDSGGVTVHAFKGTWVSGASSLVGNGFRGGADQWNQLRWKAALKRFHPAHARVAQGAVRGIPNPDLAWVAFEDAMLKDLTFAQR